MIFKTDTCPPMHPGAETGLPRVHMEFANGYTASIVFGQLSAYLAYLDPFGAVNLDSQEASPEQVARFLMGVATMKRPSRKELGVTARQIEALEAARDKGGAIFARGRNMGGAFKRLCDGLARRDLVERRSPHPITDKGRRILDLLNL
jgi:hypothetical protein